MPNRILREGILHSPRMAQLGWAEEVFYRRLHSVVDDYGRYYADQGLLRAACYPRQLNKVSDPDIGKWLRSCAAAGLVRVYPAEDGESYLEVLDFDQQVRAKKSKFPEPPIACEADATQALGNGVADAPVFVSESVSESVSDPPKAPKGADDRFEAFWAVYPARVGKEAARKAFAKVNPDEALLEAMVAALAWQSRTEKWTKDKGAYIPNPATWLNAHRWLDEPPVTAGPPSSYNPGIEATQRLLREQAEHAAKATPPPAHILALRSRRSQEVA